MRIFVGLLPWLIASVSAADQTYSYDAATNTCVDRDGKAGVNFNAFVECGHIKDQQFDALVTKSNMSLKGLVLEGVWFKNGLLLSEVDLTGARFFKVNLGQHSSFFKANFNNSNLEKVLAVSGPDIKSSQFKDATITDLTGGGARIFASNFRGAKLISKSAFSSLLQSDIRDADLSGFSPLLAQRLDGTRFNSRTLLPTGFTLDYAVNVKKMIYEE